MAVDTATLVFKRAQRGLYAGKTRLSGNHISPSKRHVKRHWVPNVQRKALWSDALNRSISLRVTTSALRQMDRMGGLDEYVMGTSPAKLASAKGESLREQITLSLGGEPRVTGVPSLRAKLSKLAADAKRGPRDEPEAQLR